MKSLGGATFCWNGISQDYSFLETLDCLYALSDQVAVAAGGIDGTFEAVLGWVYKQDKPEKVILIPITEEHWNSQQGREKLSYFSNLAIEQLTTDFFAYLQCDEIFYERGFEAMREAIQIDGAEAYIVKRYHVWRDPLHRLEVEQDRKPASTEVVRIGAKHCRCVGDAESISASVVHQFRSLETFEIYHNGFIRFPKPMALKARHMIVDIFGMGMDERIGDSFDHRKFGFTPEEIVPVPAPIPRFIRDWCKERHPECPI